MNKTLDFSYNQIEYAIYLSNYFSGVDLVWCETTVVAISNGRRRRKRDYTEFHLVL